ncbi:unnamed protein product [Amoebophrya sp. A25]|nr:unnamed protein product [Amoebophrya sp. A25]|eukprot:GSA25T00011521001.1
MEGYGGGARARARQFRDKDAPISFCEPSLALTDLLQHDALDTRDGESWLARKDLQRSTLQRSFACMSDVPFAEVLPCPSLRSDIDLTGRPTRVGEIPPDLDPLEREVLTLVETCRVIRCQLCGIVNSFAADLDLPPVLVGSMMHLHYEFGLENQSGAHDGQFSFSLEFQTRLRGMQNWMLRLRTFFREIWLPLSEAIHAPTRFMKLPELLLTRPFVWSAPVSAGGHGWQPFRHREVEVRELLGELRQKLLAGYIGGPICDSVRNMHRYDRKKADDFHSRVTLHGYEKAFETDETFIKEDESREAWEDYRDMTDTKFFKVNRVHFMMLMTAERDEEEVPYAMLYRLFSKKYHAPQHTAGEASTEVLLPELTELCWRRFSGRPHALLHEHRRVKARARPWDVQDAGDLPTHLAKWDSVVMGTPWSAVLAIPLGMVLELSGNGEEPLLVLTAGELQLFLMPSVLRAAVFA